MPFARRVEDDGEAGKEGGECAYLSAVVEPWVQAKGALALTKLGSATAPERVIPEPVGPIAPPEWDGTRL